MWPIVPILTCGLVRSNFFLATRPFHSLTRRGLAADTDCRGLGATWGRGAHNRTRTDDLFLTKEVLCQLSYVGPGPIVLRVIWWAGRESNPHSRTRLVYSQRSSPPAQPTHCGSGTGSRNCGLVMGPAAGNI